MRRESALKIRLESQRSALARSLGYEAKRTKRPIDAPIPLAIDVAPAESRKPTKSIQ